MNLALCASLGWQVEVAFTVAKSTAVNVLMWDTLGGDVIWLISE